MEYEENLTVSLSLTSLKYKETLRKIQTERNFYKYPKKTIKHRCHNFSPHMIFKVYDTFIKLQQRQLKKTIK